MTALEPSPPTGSESEWMQTEQALAPQQLAILQALPEHLVDDLADAVLFIAKTEPSFLSANSFQGMLSMIVFFLRRPWAIKSPHLRAKLGQVLVYLYLPTHALDDMERWSGSKATEGPQRHILASHSGAQQHLAPGLLLLYGDVEKTGTPFLPLIDQFFYDFIGFHVTFLL